MHFGPDDEARKNMKIMQQLLISHILVQNVTYQ